MVIYDQISIIEIVTPMFPGNILFLDRDQTSVGKITSGGQVASQGFPMDNGDGAVFTRFFKRYY